MPKSAVRLVSCRLTVVFLLTGGCIAAYGQATPADASAPPHQAVVNQYCLGCHNSKAKIGGLALDAIVSSSVTQHPEEWEKVIRKLRGHYMPPPGLPRPDNHTYDLVVSSLAKT